MTWTEWLNALKAGEAQPPPVVATLKLGLLDDWGEGWIKKVWTPSPELENRDGSMFGGYLAALADQALAFATMTVMPEGMSFRTLNLQLNFVRIGRRHPLHIEGRVVAQTRQLVTARAEFRRPDGELIAEATGQQLLATLPPAMTP